MKRTIHDIDDGMPDDIVSTTYLKVLPADLKKELIEYMPIEPALFLWLVEFQKRNNRGYVPCSYLQHLTSASMQNINDLSFRFMGKYFFVHQATNTLVYNDNDRIFIKEKIAGEDCQQLQHLQHLQYEDWERFIIKLTDNSRQLDCGIKRIRDIKFSSHGDKIILLSADNAVYIWDIKTNKLLLELSYDQDQGHLLSAWFNADENEVITRKFYDLHNIKILCWRLFDKEQQKDFLNNVNSI